MKFRAGSDAQQRTATLQLGTFTARHLRALAGDAELWSLESLGLSSTSSIADEEAQTLAAIAELRQRPDVEYAHENLYMEYFATPNDPLYPQQWHYSTIGMPQAWDSTTGNVTVAILDTGRIDHPDFAGRWVQGYDFGAGDPNPTDDGVWHHGLHVAGIIGANSNNGLGASGICWNCPLMPIKVSREDTLVMANVGQAIHWAVDHGARVINMSFGTNNYASPCSLYPYMQEAVTYAVTPTATRPGTVVVAAAGNLSSETANVTPASCNGVISVAASTRANLLASYSNHGAVTLTAPAGGPGLYGVGIGCPADGTTYYGTDGSVSAWAIAKPEYMLLPGDYCYRYLAGTSMAAPHVAGVAALIASRWPTLTPAQIKDRLVQTATSMAPCVLCGAGLLNAAGAVGAPLAITQLSCSSTNAAFSCTAATSGGMGGNTYAWSVIANGLLTSQNGTTASGACPPTANTTLRFTVTDGGGASVSQDTTFACARRNLDARFVQQVVPTRVISGKPFTASVTMQNTGVTPWTAATAFRLGSQAPQDNTLWTGSNRIVLAPTDTIATGQQKTFSISGTAPTVLGSHAFQWRMVQDGVSWFGEPSILLNIQVISDPCPPCPPGELCPDVLCPVTETE